LKRHSKSITANRIICFIHFVLEFDLACDSEEDKLYYLKVTLLWFNHKDTKRVDLNAKRLLKIERSISKKPLGTPSLSSLSDGFEHQKVVMNLILFPCQ